MVLQFGLSAVSWLKMPRGKASTEMRKATRALVQALQANNELIRNLQGLESLQTISNRQTARADGQLHETWL